MNHMNKSAPGFEIDQIKFKYQVNLNEHAFVDG